MTLFHFLILRASHNHHYFSMWQDIALLAGSSWNFLIYINDCFALLSRFWWLIYVDEVSNWNLERVEREINYFSFGASIWITNYFGKKENLKSGLKLKISWSKFKFSKNKKNLTFGKKIKLVEFFRVHKWMSHQIWEFIFNIADDLIYFKISIYLELLVFKFLQFNSD